MALSGSFTGKTGNEYIQPRIKWSATQSVSGNYSTVTATLYYSRTNTGYTTKGTGTFSLTINGKKASVTKALTITHNSNTVALTHKVQVTHAADGTKSVAISATGVIPGTTLSSTTISSTVTLDTIPRATTPKLSASSVFMGSSVTISTPGASSSFTHDLAYKFAGSTWKSIRSGVGASYSWTVPDLSGSIKDAASGTLTIRCITKKGDTTIGTKTISMTVKVPTDASYQPTIDSVTVTETVAKIAEADLSVFVQHKSKIKVEIEASGAAGSGIKSCSTTFLGSTYKGTSWAHPDVIGQKGNLKLVTTVTDTRGRTAKKTTTISVQPYYKPKIFTFEVGRASAIDTPDPDGTFITVWAEGSVPGYLQSLDNNNFSVSIEYKESVASADKWETLKTFTPNESFGEFFTSTSGGFTLQSFINSKSFTTDKQYDFRITASDFFGESSSSLVILPSGVVIADIKANGKGIGIGKTAELDDTVECAWAIKANAGVKGLGNNILWDFRHELIPGKAIVKTDKNEQFKGKISDQTTGVVFAWSKYDPTNKYYNWLYFFVPKSHVVSDAGQGVFMSDPYLGMRKYVYIWDDGMNGHANNLTSGTSNGIAYDNSQYNLMYVVGV